MSIPIGVILALSMLLLCSLPIQPRIENTVDVELTQHEKTKKEN